MLAFPLETNTGLPEDGGALDIYVTSEKDKRKKERNPQGKTFSFWWVALAQGSD